MKKIILFLNLALLMPLVSAAQCVGTTSLDVFINVCNNINESAASQLITLPNPATNEVTILLNGLENPSQFVVTDAVNKLIEAPQVVFSSKQKITINTSSWSSGMYYVRFANGSRAKFVKL